MTTEYIAIHDIDYTTTYPQSTVLSTLTALGFAINQSSKHINHSSVNCGAIIALADKNGCYGHYGFPNDVNLIELIVWRNKDFDACCDLANKIAKALDFQVYYEDK